jgi:hypothetical protein
MKPRTGVYLSESAAARLAAAATLTGATKSALVEAALDRFLTSDPAADNLTTLTGRLTELGVQIERLNSDLKMVNEVVALHARFHLAVTPSVSAAEQQIASAVGAERFEEFATQVGRRVEMGTSLVRETMSRRARMNEGRSADDFAASNGTETSFKSSESDFRAFAPAGGASEPNAAVREDGSLRTFSKQTHAPLPRESQRR